MKKVLIASLFICSALQAQLTKYVNPFIGTGGTGHTFPGATTPFAMVQLSPDTRIDGSWEGCSGYHYSDSIIYGFSHTHLSGTGVSDYGDIAFMPYFSKTSQFEKLKTQNFQSKFSHKNEKASAGYYSVKLDDIPVKVELTATTRTGFQRYTFNEDGYGYIVLNLKHRDELVQGKIEKVRNTNYEVQSKNIEIRNLKYKGIRVSKAWATRQELYYGFEVSSFRVRNEREISLKKADFSGKNLRNDEKYLIDPINEYIVIEANNETKLILEYKVVKGQQILIKTGISTVDADAALNNLNVENPNWNFELIKHQANNSWEKELSKIEVADSKILNLSTYQLNNLYTFYTALYHCMIHPSIMNDVDGRYRGRDGKIHQAEGFNYYTVFSLWDTHRALHPLLNIIDKKRSHDFMITFLKQFEQSGRLPMWELWNNETDCMIGFHSVSVILDAYRKQVITKDELKQLWPAVKAEAMSNRFGLDKFREKGFLSVEDESESVSKTLEYAYDMWCVSEIAKVLGNDNDEKYFRKYSNAWQELQNSETGFIQPRKNGNWLQNFNPYEVNNNYTEANAWQYSFYHPQHPFYSEIMLDSLFKAKPKTEGRTQPDITGLIGQYAHGNEPSHNYIYLLNSKKRIKYLKYVYENFYTNNPDGLIGNEDCGQMSAWYVMSALGFYQTCPGTNKLSVGLPVFNRAKINLENNSAFIVTNKTLQSSTIESNFFVDQKPDKKIINHNTFFLHAPLISTTNLKPFVDSTLVTINLVKNSNQLNNIIYFTLNNDSFKKYTSPFFIKENSMVKAYVSNSKSTSNQSIAYFYKRPHNYSIQLNCKYNKQYTADGDDGIIDGQYGYVDWRKGGWQGYQAQDFEAIIDMKEVKSLSEISANFLQDTRSWILFPTKVEFYTSNDNIKFTLVQTLENNIPANDYTIQSQKLKFKSQNENLFARYIKIKATNFGKLPEWHAGKGDDAFIFIDEIEIK
ncbi:MAG: GH92 family glycosyl hydrolase [Chitinophagaceae bacterium]|nr:GH92 family glycosyl hydrolase [Chitinophagaceae bacterium]